MNKVINKSFFLLLAIGLLVFSSFINFSTVKVETQMCYGPSQTTQSLHNTPCAGLRSPVNGIYYGCFANAAFRKYEFTVSCGTGWHFTGNPKMYCVKDNEGSFGWNGFDRSPDRFFITEKTPTFMRATVWAGSHDIEIKLGCEATKD